MARVAFQMIVFNGDHFLEPVLEAIEPYGPIYVTEGPVQYYVDRGFTESTDNTMDILLEHVPAKHIVRGQWSEKDEMMNAVEHLIPGNTSHVWMVDADEVWKDQDIQTILEVLDNVDSMSFRMNSFFAGFDHIMTGFEENFEVHRIKRWYPGATWVTHRPPTICDPVENVPWRDSGRHCSHMETDAIGVRFYHYSYVYPYQMMGKSSYYQNYTGGYNIPDYFNKVWLPWATGNAMRRVFIEEEYRGVHDWLPSRRGDCFTRRFTLDHPKVIQKRLPELRARWNKEIKEVKAQRTVFK